MSCQHGNWSDCELCAEVEAARKQGEQDAFAHVTAVLASEIECSVFESVVQPALSIATQGATP